MRGGLLEHLSPDTLLFSRVRPVTLVQSPGLGGFATVSPEYYLEVACLPRLETVLGEGLLTEFTLVKRQMGMERERESSDSKARTWVQPLKPM